jgi:hypothetical protein
MNTNTDGVSAMSAELSLSQDDVEWLVSEHQKTYLIRGHVDPEAMLEAVKEYGECEPESFSKPTHQWWRTYPKWVEGDRVQWFQQAEPNARGAFKCTVMTKDW